MRQFGNCLRLNYSREWNAGQERGIALLGALLREQAAMRDGAGDAVRVGT